MTNELANQVLTLLYDRGEMFYSLVELAEAARTDLGRLSAALERLEAAGRRLERSPGHGVRLVRPAALSAHLIERDLGTRRVGRSVIVFGEVESTNDVAFDAARQAGRDGLAVLAEFQRAGRGRQGRPWISPQGTNILLSVLLIDERPPRLPHDAVTIAAGLAVAEAVEDACGLRATLKWPNDVLLEGSKLAGVLVEVRTVAARRCMVVGIGVNVGAGPPAEQVDSPATSLAEHAGGVERIEVARALLRRLDGWTDTIAAGGLTALHDAWVARCGMLNERVTVRSGGRDYTGRVLDVTACDGLVLSCDDGRCVRLPADGATVLPASPGSRR